MVNNCLRCGHTWKGKGNTIPMACPKCKSPYWNLPRRNKLAVGKHYYHGKVKTDGV